MCVCVCVCITWFSSGQPSLTLLNLILNLIFTNYRLIIGQQVTKLTLN